MNICISENIQGENKQKHSRHCVCILQIDVRLGR